MSLSKIVWLCGVFVLLLWSLASWGIGVLLGGSGEFLAAQAAAWAPHEPEVELAVASAREWFAHFGVIALWFVWAVGSLSIVFGTWLAAQIAVWLRGALGRIAPHASAAWSGARARLQARTHGA